MREYELAVLLHPDLEIDQDKALTKIDKLIDELKGKVLKRDDWGKRKLAYPINKQQHALYCFYHLQLEPASIGELERSLQISNEIIRYLVVKYEPPPEVTDTRDSSEEKAETKAAKPKPAAGKSTVKTVAKDGEAAPAKTADEESE